MNKRISIPAAPAALTIEPKPVTAEYIEQLERDQRHLKAIIHMLNMGNVGLKTHSPAARVKMLLQQRERHRNVIVKLIARKKAEPYL